MRPKRVKNDPIEHDSSSRSKPNPSLVPGELPGYTGWARPSITLAGSFHMMPPYPSGVAFVGGDDWSFTIACQAGASCPAGKDEETWFYARAYGPSIITGRVESLKSKKGMYRIYFSPMDAGVYTVEVVVTFSKVPPLTSFPLTKNNETQVPLYEGYLLPDFPYLLTVRGNFPPHSSSTAYCSPRELESPHARWKVVDSVRHHTTTYTTNSKPKPISLQGYQDSTNSLGFQLDYQHADCRLVPENPVFWKNCGNLQHIVLIGDSVMRLQSQHLQTWLQQNTNIQVTFYELYGGTLRCDRLSGPKLADMAQEMAAYPADRTAVVFNTGLHDLHRLCGSEWTQDRATYLTPKELQQPCLETYQTTVRRLWTETIETIPARIKIFQTTTAAWPKYGNYGVAWSPEDGQRLPLDAGFVNAFNQVAVQELQSLQPKKQQSSKRKQALQFVDAYEVTLARPDHREVDAKVKIGKKLSHPGPQVVSAMVRTFALRIMQQMCPRVLE